MVYHHFSSKDNVFKNQPSLDASFASDVFDKNDKNNEPEEDSEEDEIEDMSEFADFFKTVNELPKPKGLEYDYMQIKRLLSKNT